jgi:aspartyl protease
MRFALRLAALAVALTGIAAAPPDQLAAIAAANGHPAAVHFRAGATRVVEGRTVSTTFELLGVTRLLRRCIAGVCGGTWFDGSREWTFGLNEVALPEEVDAGVLTLRTLAAITSFAFAEPGFRRAGGTVTAAGTGRWRVRAPEGLELIAIVDPVTGALQRVETAEGRTIAGYGHEVRAGGAAFALQRGGAFEYGSLDEVSVAAGPLGPPAGVTPSFAGGDALTLGADPIPIVPCVIAGRHVRCLLDTGATPSAITLTVAEALNLEPHGELEISGIGRFATGFVEAGPLELGAARFARARFAVVPPTSAAPFDVVVGSDLLAHVRLSLDRTRRTARISAPGGRAAGTAVALTFHGGSPIVQAMFGPQGARALLDTGDQAIVSFGYGTYREGPQWKVIDRGQALGIGGGTDDMLTVQVPDVRIGQLAIGEARATVRRTQRQAHVGVGLWDRFVIDLDETGAKVWFSPP